MEEVPRYKAALASRGRDMGYDSCSCSTLEDQSKTSIVEQWPGAGCLTGPMVALAQVVPLQVRY